MTKFSGPILYNICDSQDVAGRGVFLFNASRIVLFINNFSVSFLTNNQFCNEITYKQHSVFCIKDTLNTFIKFILL